MPLSTERRLRGRRWRRRSRSDRTGSAVFLHLHRRLAAPCLTTTDPSVATAGAEGVACLRSGRGRGRGEEREETSPNVQVEKARLRARAKCLCSPSLPILPSFIPQRDGSLGKPLRKVRTRLLSSSRRLTQAAARHDVGRLRNHRLLRRTARLSSGVSGPVLPTTSRQVADDLVSCSHL